MQQNKTPFDGLWGSIRGLNREEWAWAMVMGVGFGAGAAFGLIYVMAQLITGKPLEWGWVLGLFAFQTFLSLWFGLLLQVDLKRRKDTDWPTRKVSA